MQNNIRISAIWSETDLCSDGSAVAEVGFAGGSPRPKDETVLALVRAVGLGLTAGTGEAGPS